VKEKEEEDAGGGEGGGVGEGGGNERRRKGGGFYALELVPGAAEGRVGPTLRRILLADSPMIDNENGDKMTELKNENVK